VSKRHQANRRKSYGRRQHELAERRDRTNQPGTAELGFDELGSAVMVDRFGYLDSRSPGLVCAMGD
jgi:hypothetical protein